MQTESKYADTYESSLCLTITGGFLQFGRIVVVLSISGTNVVVFWN
jgi:hypothetical protein